MKKFINIIGIVLVLLSDVVCVLMPFFGGLIFSICSDNWLCMLTNLSYILCFPAYLLLFKNSVYLIKDLVNEIV